MKSSWRRTTLGFGLVFFLGLMAFSPSLCRADESPQPWTRAATYREYQSWSLEHKAEIYRQVVASDFYKQWSEKPITGRAAEDPKLGAYDAFLKWLPLSPTDMLEVYMQLERVEFMIPKMNHLLFRRWLEINYPEAVAEGIESDERWERGEEGGVRREPIERELSAKNVPTARATVGTNRNSAYDTSPGPEDYDGEIQVVVNPLNPNQVVSMANTWDNMGNTAQCGGGTQAIFYSNNGGDTWGYTCAPRGSLYSGLSCTNETGSDPALYWDDSGNIYADYMSVCYNSSWTSVDGVAMVVAKSTDGGAHWSPHGVLQNSYGSSAFEDKNFYIIDNNPTSPYHGRHYSCWDRDNDELIKYSTDGGVSWTEVDLPDHPGTSDLGCEMAVEDNGTVHLVFDTLTCPYNCTGEDMYYTRSTDGGATWSSLVHVRSITNPVSFGSSSDYGPQDSRGLNPFGAIDVDNSGGSCDGNLYATFTDDADGNGVGTADIWVSRSTNGGNTWQSAVRVNDTPDPDNSIQFHPFLVVDQSNGDVYVAYHDCRNDPSNHAVDYYVARSTDCGQTWENVKASQPSGEFNNNGISYTNLNTSDNSNANPNQFGEYMGLDVLSGTAYLAWCDTRQFYPSSTSDSQAENVGFAKVVFCSVAAPASCNAVNNGNNRIDVTWSSVTGATEYHVYRSMTSGGPYSQVGTAAGTTYSDTTVSGGITYHYVVRAYDQCESPNSPEASETATGTCTEAPSFGGLESVTSPQDTTCTLDLSWTAAASLCSGGISYNIYRSETTGFTPSVSNRIATGVTGTTYSDTDGLVSGTVYSYIVRAVDTGNGSEETNVVEQNGTPSGPDTDGTFQAGAEAGDGAMFTTDPWTISSARSHSGTSSYFSGYNNNECAYIRTGPLALTSGQSSTMTYWTAWDIENQWDGGVVEISTNGGSSWSSLTPTSGYPGSFRSDSGDACDYGTDGSYTGTGNLTFAQYTVDLSAYNGQTVMIRWNFSTDGSVSYYEGWYVDDIAITHTQVPGTCTTGSVGPCSVYGDTDDSGSVTNADQELLVAHLFGSDTASCPDVDGSGAVNAADLAAWLAH